MKEKESRFAEASKGDINILVTNGVPGSPQTLQNTLLTSIKCIWVTINKPLFWPGVSEDIKCP